MLPRDDDHDRLLERHSRTRYPSFAQEIYERKERQTEPMKVVLQINLTLPENVNRERRLHHPAQTEISAIGTGSEHSSGHKLLETKSPGCKKTLSV